MEPIVKAINIHKSFKDVKALAGVNLEIMPSEFTALLGPNGAGKTTLVEIIEGIQFPDSGEITLFGKPWQGNRDGLHQQLGISFQETRFEDKLTTRETLSLFASFYGLGKTRVDEILDLINLTEKHKSYVVNLSGGQRQKLALGISLIHNPRLLILDEPTTGLDPTARREIWDILHRLKEQHGTSMILTTHYMEEAENLCSNIVIIDHGKVLARGSLQELISQSGTSEIIQFKVDHPDCFPDIKNHPEVKRLEWDKDGLHLSLHVTNTSSFLPDLISRLNHAGCHISELRCRYVTLDDLFIQMTGRKLTDSAS